MVTIIIFRAHTIGDALGYMRRIVSLSSNESVFVSVRDTLWLIIVIIFMIIIEWLNRNSSYDLQVVPSNKILRNGFYILLIAAVYTSFMLSIEDNNTFIYFQF